MDAGDARCYVDKDWWAVDAEDCDRLSDYARREGVRSVLEFGPGRSTLAFAAAGARVVTYESDRRWLPQLRAEFGGEPLIELRAYENAPELEFPELVGARFDLALVDGPPGGDGAPPDNRHNAVRLAMRHTDAIFLHDTLRPREAAIVEWAAADGWAVTQFHSAKGLALLRRPETGRAAREV